MSGPWQAGLELHIMTLKNLHIENYCNVSSGAGSESLLDRRLLLQRSCQSSKWRVSKRQTSTQNKNDIPKQGVKEAAFLSLTFSLVQCHLIHREICFLEVCTITGQA